MLKAYEMDDEGTVYAAHDSAEAVTEFENDFGCMVDQPDYPRELTDAELDKQYDDRDGYGFKTGETTCIREWLDEKTVAGFLCGGVY